MLFAIADWLRPDPPIAFLSRSAVLPKLKSDTALERPLERPSWASRLAASCSSSYRLKSKRPLWHGSRLGKLSGMEPRVGPTQRQQAFVGPRLPHLAALDVEDLACATDRREAVGDDEGRPAGKHTIERSLD